jgi:hypothetical protein
VLDELGQAGMIDWSRTCLDSVSVRAKKGGDLTGPGTTVAFIGCVRAVGGGVSGRCVGVFVASVIGGGCGWGGRVWPR